MRVDNMSDAQKLLSYITACPQVHYGQYGGAICTTSEQAEGVRRTLSARLGGGYAGIRAVAQAGHQSIEEISSQVWRSAYKDLPNFHIQCKRYKTILGK